MEAVFLCHVVDEGKVADRIQLVRVEVRCLGPCFSITHAQVSYSTQTPTEIMFFKYGSYISDTYPSDKISETEGHTEK